MEPSYQHWYLDQRRRMYKQFVGRLQRHIWHEISQSSKNHGTKCWSTLDAQCGLRHPPWLAYHSTLTWHCTFCSHFGIHHNLLLLIFKTEVWFLNYLHILLRNKIKSIVPRATFEGRFGISLLYLRIQLLSLASNRFFQRDCFGIHHNLCFLCFLPHSFQHKNMVLTIEFTCSWEIKWSQLCQGNIVLCCAILKFSQKLNYWGLLRTNLLLPHPWRHQNFSQELVSMR
jgi:hypothetical protein